MSPFIVPSLKKIVGANLEQIDKVDFRDTQTYRHTDIHTDRSDLIYRTFPGGGPISYFKASQAVYGKKAVVSEPIHN